MSQGQSGGHVQSLILACTLIIMGFLTFMIGLVADVIAANRKLLQDTQYHARRTEYDALYLQQKIQRDAVKVFHVVGDGKSESTEWETRTEREALES